MADMEVDILTALSSPSDMKRPSMSPHPPYEKRHRPDSQQVEINERLTQHANNQAWAFLFDRAGIDLAKWRTFLAQVFFIITNVNIFPPQTLNQSIAIVNSLSEKELEEWKGGVWKGLKEGDWTDLLALVILVSGDSTATRDFPHPLSDQDMATQDSWNHPFQGDAAKVLWDHIVNHFQPSDSSVYARYATIVQSSGMGKSRSVDEMAKNHLVIPINLREEGLTGYPPADDNVRNYLTGVISRKDAYNRSCAFLEALFTQTNAVLQDIHSKNHNEMITQFRDFMNKDQKMSGHNNNRKNFFSEVIQKAMKLQKSVKPNAPSELPAYEALATLVASMCSMPSQTTKKSKPKHSEPIITLCLDEAHTLTMQKGTDLKGWSMFNELQHALRTVQNLPVFTLFLSTTGKISQCSPATREDHSARVIARKLTLIPPFSDLGIDHLVTSKVNLGGNWKLQDLAADAYMCLLGRPLFATRYLRGGKNIKLEIIQFAAGKLLNAEFTIKSLSNDQMLACLSQRFPIEFKSTNYITQASERKQVEGHMRVCLKVDAAFETMTTTTSSEPLLSEAAYFIMQKSSFNAVEALKSVMEGFAISKGDRGEFIVLLLLTLARDAAVGPADEFGRPFDRCFGLSDFLCEYIFQASNIPQNLTNEESIDALKNLGKDFPDARLHFSHFIKVQEQKAIDIASLLLLLGRGAGVLCANNQRGVDGILAFLKNGITLMRRNGGAILIQAKNDVKYSHVPQHKLFTDMDPYDIGMLGTGDCAVPLIKIVFALAAKKPYLNVVRHEATEDYNAITYDIWCAGISPDILGPVREQDAGLWDALLQASYGWKDLYGAGSKKQGDLRRSATPGAALDPAHWDHWADRS